MFLPRSPFPYHFLGPDLVSQPRACFWMFLKRKSSAGSAYLFVGVFLPPLLCNPNIRCFGQTGGMPQDCSYFTKCVTHTWLLSQNDALTQLCTDMHWLYLTEIQCATSISCVASIHGEISTWHHEMDIKRVCFFCPRTWNTQLSRPHSASLTRTPPVDEGSPSDQYQDSDIILCNSASIWQ